MNHQAKIVAGSVKNTGHGIAFVMRCCEGEGAMESSVHIQQAGRYSPEELKRVLDDYLAEHAARHADHVAAVNFVEQYAKEGCGCGNSSKPSAGPSAGPSDSGDGTSAPKQSSAT